MLFEDGLRCLLQRVGIAIHFFALLVDIHLRQSRLGFAQTRVQGSLGGLGELDGTHNQPSLGPGERLTLYFAAQYDALFITLSDQLLLVLALTRRTMHSHQGTLAAPDWL